MAYLCILLALSFEMRSRSAFDIAGDSTYRSKRCCLKFYSLEQMTRPAKQPISSLYPSKEECAPESSYDEVNYHEHYYSGKDQDKPVFDSTASSGYGSQQKSVNIATILIWLVVIALITWFLLWAFKPDFIQETNATGDPTGQIDYSQLFLWTAVITLVITFLIWIFLKASGGNYGSFC